MSLRRAVIQQLKTHVFPLNGNAFQAYLAPVGVVPPYATVKMAGTRGTPELNFAGDQIIEVRLYRSQDCYATLDALKQMAVVALNGVVITDAPTGERYHVRWTPFGAGDFADEERRLIGCLVTFEAVVIHERGGQL